VAFTKVLQCINYHTLIHPFHCSFYPPLCHLWNSFSRYHFCIYIYVYTFFAPYSSSYPLSHHLHPPSDASPPPLGRTCSALLFSILQKKDKKKNMTFLLVCDISCLFLEIWMTHWRENVVSVFLSLAYFT
jgi:hypothetical protein